MTQIVTSQVLQNLRFCTHSFALQNRRFCTQPVTKASLLLQTPCTASPCKSKICTQAERLRAAPLRLHSFALQNPPRSGVGFVRSQAQPTAVQLPAQQSCATAANRRFASKQPFDLQQTLRVYKQTAYSRQFRPFGPTARRSALSL